MLVSVAVIRIENDLLLGCIPVYHVGKNRHPHFKLITASVAVAPNLELGCVTLRLLTEAQ